METAKKGKDEREGIDKEIAALREEISKQKPPCRTERSAPKPRPHPLPGSDLRPDLGAHAHLKPASRRADLDPADQILHRRPPQRVRRPITRTSQTVTPKHEALPVSQPPDRRHERAGSRSGRRTSA